MVDLGLDVLHAELASHCGRKQSACGAVPGTREYDRKRDGTLQVVLSGGIPALLAGHLHSRRLHHVRATLNFFLHLAL